jgi:hypothetical protein
MKRLAAPSVEKLTSYSTWPALQPPWPCVSAAVLMWIPADPVIASTVLPVASPEGVTVVLKGSSRR